MNDHYVKYIYTSCNTPITKKDVLEVSRSPESIPESVGDFIDQGISIINTFKGFRVYNFNTINGYTYDVDNLKFVMTFLTKQKELGGFTSENLPEAAQWSAALFQNCTPNDIAGLERLATMADMANHLSTFMVSHHVLVVLGGGVGFCMLNMLHKEANSGKLYRDAASTIKVQYYTKFRSKVFHFAKSDYSKLVVK